MDDDDNDYQHLQLDGADVDAADQLAAQLSSAEQQLHDLHAQQQQQQHHHEQAQHGHEQQHHNAHEHVDGSLEHQHHHHHAEDDYANAVASTSQLPHGVADPYGPDPSPQPDQQQAQGPSSQDQQQQQQQSQPQQQSQQQQQPLPFPSFHDEPHFLSFARVEDAEDWLEGQRVYARWGLKYFHRANNSRTQDAYKAEQLEGQPSGGPSGRASLGHSPTASSSAAMAMHLDEVDVAPPPSNAEGEPSIAGAPTPPTPAPTTTATPGGSHRRRGPKVKWEWTKIFICNHAGKYPGSKSKTGKQKKEPSIKMGCQAKIYMRRRKDALDVEVEYRWRHNHNPSPAGGSAAGGAAPSAAGAGGSGAPAPPKPKKLSQHQRQVLKQERARLAQMEQDQLHIQQQADALLPSALAHAHAAAAAAAGGAHDGGAGGLSSEMLSSLGVDPTGGQAHLHHVGGSGQDPNVGHPSDEMDLSGYVQQQALGDDDDGEDGTGGPLDPSLAHLTAFGDMSHHGLDHRSTGGSGGEGNTNGGGGGSGGGSGAYDQTLPSAGPPGDEHASSASDANPYALGGLQGPSNDPSFAQLPSLGDPSEHDHHHHHHHHLMSDEALLHAGGGSSANGSNGANSGGGGAPSSTPTADAFYASLGAPVMASVLVSTVQDALGAAEKWKDAVERSPQAWDPLRLHAVSERFRAARDELERLMGDQHQ